MLNVAVEGSSIISDTCMSVVIRVTANLRV